MLVIPTLNDFPKPLEDLGKWIADNCGDRTPFHLSAYFPRYRTTIAPTSSALLERLREMFIQKLKYVYIGNAQTEGGADTFCIHCGAAMIRRIGFTPDLSGMASDGRCSACGADNGIIVRRENVKR